MTAELQAGDDLVQGSVATAGNDKIRSAGMGTGEIDRVAALFRDKDGTEVSRPVEDRNDLRQETPGLTGTGIGVDDDENFLQISIHNPQFTILQYLMDRL